MIAVVAPKAAGVVPVPAIIGKRLPTHVRCFKYGAQNQLLDQLRSRFPEFLAPGTVYGEI